jgi:hypothetical protein
LTLEDLDRGGGHVFKPDTRALERAWRVLSGTPKRMTDLFTRPDMQWSQVVLQWLLHQHKEG